MRLPASAANGPLLPAFDKDPPQTMTYGEKLELRVSKDAAEKAKLVLQAGPAGMALDAATGKLTWTAAKQQYGRTDVVIGLAGEGYVVSVLRFRLHLKDR